MSVADQNFVEVYRAANLTQAYAVQLALHEADIPVVIANSNLQDAIGEVPGGWSSAPRLMVDECHLAQAREIIGIINPHSDAKSGLSLSEVIGIVPLAPFATLFAVADYLVPPSKPVEVEQTCCLVCGAEISDVETKCSQCGWTYESAADVESELADIV